MSVRTVSETLQNLSKIASLLEDNQQQIKVFVDASIGALLGTSDLPWNEIIPQIVDTSSEIWVRLTSN